MTDYSRSTVETSADHRAWILAWMRAHCEEHRDGRTGEINHTALVEDWDRCCADGRVPAHDPRNRRHLYAGDQGAVTATPATLRAGVARGWLAVHLGPTVYHSRWTLTPAGRAVLDAAEVRK